ncbi:hypothetical protein ABPG72_002027 [Tetrahymena utriculariae]
MNNRIRKFNNSGVKGSNLKYAYAHNLTPQELQNITNNYLDIKNNNDSHKTKNQTAKNQKQGQQNDLQHFGYPDTNVYIKAKLVSKEEKKFDMIRNSQHNQLKLFDQEKYMESESDCIFSNKNKNNEIYDRLQLKILECLENKKNYSLFLFGTSNTGKNHVLLNKQLLECYGNPQLTSAVRDQQGGIIQRALSDICTHLKTMNQDDKEVMISIIGFYQDRVIDLLNLDQNLESIQKDNLKIKTEENMGISIEDLIQMSIWSFSEFVSVYRIYSFMKKILKEQIGMHIKTIVIQISVAKVSQQKDFIEKIEQKFTFVKMTNCQQNLENISNLGFCMDSLKKNSNSIPFRQKKLTFFLKDCLNVQSHVTLFQTVSNQDSLKSQISTMQLASQFNKKQMIKKNYLSDKEFLEQLQKEDQTGSKQIYQSMQENFLNSSVNHIQDSDRLGQQNKQNLNNQLKQDSDNI